MAAYGFLNSQLLQDSQSMDDDISQFPPSHPPRQPTPTPEQANLRDDLLQIDPDRTLSIWGLDSLDTDDSLVKEYVELVRKFKKPSPPSAEEIELFKSREDSVSCSSETQVKVINYISTYFQTLYFIQNVNNATEQEVTLFNPTTKFLIPGYSFLPLFYFDKVKEHKQNMVLAMQVDATRAAHFSAEFYLLRVFNLLKEDLKDNFESNGRYTFTVLYESARKNFRQNFKTKNIDWKEREGKVHGSVPKWRKEGATSAPKEIKNRYASKLSSALAEGKVKLSAAQINNPSSTIFSSQVSQVPEENNGKSNEPNAQRNKHSHRVPVKFSHQKNHNKNGYANRPKNPYFNKNRQINGSSQEL